MTATAEQKLTGWQLAELIVNSFDEDTGEIDADALDALELKFENKIEAMGHVVRNLRALAKGARDEGAHQKGRADRFINQADRLEDRAQFLMERVGKTKVVTATVNAVIGEGSLRTVVDDVAKLPAIYVRISETVTPDKKLIGQHIDGGAVIPGAHRERGPSRLKFK